MPMRGGTVYLSAGETPERVWLEGEAVTVFHIEMLHAD